MIVYYITAQHIIFKVSAPHGRRALDAGSSFF